MDDMASREHAHTASGGQGNPALANRAAELDPRYWEVEIRVCGERILTIGHEHLSGLADIDKYADVVRTCAEHLMSFIGPEEPPPCFACGNWGFEVDDAGNETGPCPVCMAETFPCPVCGGWDDEDQMFCSACGGVGLLASIEPADGVGRDPRPPVIDGDKSRDEPHPARDERDESR